MSYVPLHHKYRPQTFAQLVGQGAIATTLSSALNRSQIAPAYLFTGARGTGKTSSARIFAKSLNCVAGDRPTPEPCGKCETCVAITKGTALDVIEIDAASNTGVDNIRELIDRAQFAPVQCRYKVYVIDECLAGDSLVLTQDGWQRIDDPGIKGKAVLSYNETTQGWEWKAVKRWLVRGEKPTLVIKTADKEIRCTANHPIRTAEGWKKAEELKVGDRILSPINPNATVGWVKQRETQHHQLSQVFNIPCATQHHQLSQVFDVPRFGIRVVRSEDHGVNGGGVGLGSEDHGVNGGGVGLRVAAPNLRSVYLDPIQSIAPGQTEAVYDIEVEDNHNFVANGLLVHNCHMLTGAAFNALLKTLEEPPNRVVFVLATTDPQRVLPTIISRCQRFDFRRIPLDDMVTHLTMIAQQESINITPNALQLVGQIAQGGLRDAESLLDQLGLMAEEVDAEEVWDLVGAVPERDLLSLVRSIAADDAEAAIDLTRRLMDRGREPLIVLQNLASFYRDLLIARTAPNRPDLVAITPDTWAQMCELVKSLPGKLLLSSQQHLRSAELQIKNTTQPRLWLEVTLLGLLPSAIAPGTEVVNTQAIKQTIAKAPTTTTTSAAIAKPTVQAPVETPAATVVSPPVETSIPLTVTPSVPSPIETPLPPTSPPSVASPIEASQPPTVAPSVASLITDPAELQQLWQQVLAEIDLASTRGLVSASCYLLELNGNALKIAVRSKGMLATVKTKAPALGKAATKALQQSVKISLIVVEGGEPARSSTVPPNPIKPKPLAENAPKIEPPPAKKPTKTAPPTETPSAPIAPPPEAAAPPVVSPPAPTNWTPDDPLNRAAKSLAQAFAGSIVDVEETPSNDGATDAIEEIEEPNDTDTPDEPPKFRNVPF